MILAFIIAATAVPAGQPVAVAERAFAAAAQADGQWAAFRRFMAPDAIMVVPKVVRAADFLADRTEAPAAVRWAPARTVTSCDGTLAFSTGPWVSPDGRHGGHFFTIWRKQPDGTWKWSYDGGTEDPAVMRLPAKATSVRATCKAPAATQAGGAEAGGASGDGTLRWRLDPTPTGTGHLLRVDYSDRGLWRPATSIVVG